MLGVRALLGRTFAPEDAVPPHQRVLVLSHATWRAHFGSDPQVVGRTVKYNGADYRIVGVMPQGFAFPDRER